MKNVIPATTAIVAPTQTPEAATAALTAYRQTLLGLILHNPLFTDAEQLRANHNAHACQCPATLAKWVRNTTREADRRRANPPATYATSEQRETIMRLLGHPKVSRQQKTSTLLGINRLTKEQAGELITKLQLLTGATAPGQQLTMPTLTRYAPKPTSKADLTYAARFVPSGGLTLADFAALPAKPYSPLAPLRSLPHCTAWTYDPRTNYPRPAQPGEFICCLLYLN